MKYLKLLLVTFAVGAFHSAYSQTFTDITHSAGITHTIKGAMSMSGGTTVIDYNADGWEDLFFTAGMPDMDCRLYKNNGDGTFTDVTASSGIEDFISDEISMTGLSFDMDNNGYPELLITAAGYLDDFDTLGEAAHRRDILLYNNGDGTFSDITTSSGLVNNTFGSSATVGDINNDGFLDLYITNHVHEMRIIAANHPVTGDFGPHFAHDCKRDKLFVNNGDLTFTDVTDSYMPVPTDTGCGLASVFTDYDNDGDVDLMVANDFGQFIVPNRLWQNNLGSNERFDEVSGQVGADSELYGMGIAVGDYDRDLDLDYYITNIGRNPFLQNKGDGTFEDIGNALNITDTWSVDPMVDSLYNVGWSTGFVDFDNDQDLDLYVVNGFINMNTAIYPILAANPDRMFVNDGNGGFSEMGATLGIADTNSSRGGSLFDFDQDGDIDIVLSSVQITDAPNAPTFGGEPRFFRNDINNGNHYLQFDLEGIVSNRDAIGAHLTVYDGGNPYLLEVFNGGAHMGNHSQIVHIGLGNKTELDSVSIRWPSGIEQTLRNIPGDQRMKVVEDTTTGTVDRPASFGQMVGVRAYPNPTTGELNLDWVQKAAGRLQFEVVDVTGKTVWNATLENVNSGRVKHTLSLTDADLANGVYLLRVISNGEMHHYKFSLQR